MDAMEWMILLAIVSGSIIAVVLLFRFFANTPWAKRRQEAFRKLAHELGGEYRQSLIIRLPSVEATLPNGKVRVEMLTSRHSPPETLISIEGVTTDQTLSLEIGPDYDIDLAEKQAKAVGKIQTICGVKFQLLISQPSILDDAPRASVIVAGVLADREDFVEAVKGIISSLGQLAEDSPMG